LGHYNEALWVDFVRNAISTELGDAMQKHISAGCNECTASVQLWQGVLSIGNQERANNPSLESVRVAKSIFANAYQKPGNQCRLLFDSLLQPVTAGVRGAATTRQFLYETDDLYIDLRLEQKSPSLAFLVGQVLERFHRQAPAQNFFVRVMDGRTLLSETTTNHFGEFQLEFKPTDSLGILIGRDQSRPEITLPLYGVSAGPENGKAFN
jgi:hypothetical protein